MYLYRVCPLYTIFLFPRLNTLHTYDSRNTYIPYDYVITSLHILWSISTVWFNASLTTRRTETSRDFTPSYASNPMNTYPCTVLCFHAKQRKGIQVITKMIIHHLISDEGIAVIFYVHKLSYFFTRAPFWSHDSTRFHSDEIND